MKTVPWILCCMLLASCSIFRKSVNHQKQQVNKSLLSFRDSIGRLTVDSSSVSRSTGWVVSSTDSGYDKVTDEVIKDYGDSVVTVRTVKEKGKKKVEQIGYTSKFDSAGAMITEHSQLQELQQEDSAATSITTKKDVKRSSFLPWWIWLILTGALALAWWKRNPILEFFKS